MRGIPSTKEGPGRGPGSKGLIWFIMEKKMAKPADPFSYLPHTMAEFVRQISPAPPVQSLPTPAPVAAGPIDGEAMLRRCGGNREMTRKILDLFARRAMSDAQRLAACVQARDAAECERLAHAFKGMAANLSATDAQALAGEIERLAAAGDFENITGPLNRFRDEIARCVAAAASAVPALSPVNQQQSAKEDRCAP